MKQIALSLLLLSLAPCAAPPPPANMRVESPAFVQEGDIPQQYTCEGTNASPPLRWSAGPEGTQTYALVADDPDVPLKTWTHWVVFDIPPGVRELPEAVPPAAVLAQGEKQGMTDFKRLGYGGPCPPSGKHRYFFKVYALDRVIGAAPEQMNKGKLLKAMARHTLGYGELMGRYERQGKKT